MARNPDARATSDAREWLVLALGVVTTGFGVTFTAAASNSGHPTVSSQVTAGVLTAVGGGILGAVISILVARASDRETLAQVTGVLQKSLASELRSSDDRLKPVRTLWHHYYLTTLHDEHIWRYEEYPFQLSSQVGSLAVEIDVKSADSNLLYRCLVEVFVRHERLTIVSRKSGDESNVFLEVYPQFDGELSEYFGVGFVRTWDATNIVTKTILSRRRLVDETAATLSPESAEILDTMWKAGFRRLNEVLPDSS